jgi:hypothetical protein
VKLFQPSASKGGRQFAPVRERELHHFIDPVVRGLSGPPGEAWVIPEMPSPLGLPDFVVLLGGEAWFLARSRVGAGPLLAEADCVVLSTLHPRRPLGRAAVARRLGWDKGRFDPVVARLIRAGVVHESGTGALTIAPGLLPSGRLMAVETKVKDWRRAVQQGRAYRTWSDNYVVLLGDVGPIALDRAQTEVKSDGAGLYSGGRWLVRPAMRRRSGVGRRLLGYEYLFASLASGPSLGRHEEV